jgi:hypothetical protein
MEQNNWILISDADIPEWHDKMTIDQIQQTTNNQTIILVKNKDAYKKPNYCSLKNPDCCIYHGLWYQESKDYLISCGIKPMITLSNNDAVAHDQLFWDESLYQPQTYFSKKYTCRFYGTNSPVLLTKKLSESKEEKEFTITLWGTNVVKNMAFRGSALIEKNTLLPYFMFVRKMYEGMITEKQLEYFLYGVPPKPKEIFKYEPLPSIDFIEKQIIKRNLKEWIIHHCSLCNYPCGYIFNIENDKVIVKYDNGCNCVLLRPPYRSSNINDIIKHMSIQTSKEYVEKIRQFWDPKTIA